jgi:protease-4
VVLGVLFLSLLANLVAVVTFFAALDEPLDSEPMPLTERFFLGDRDASDKVAVVRVSGVISESGIRYPLRQLEVAARDRHVKAVVLRVDSPGGTVTASEELYQNVVNIRDDTGRRFKSTGPKPVSVSMGALAASGGYYVSVAGRPVSAETTTITGSIGVFAALPSVAEWTRNHGVRVELVKAGDIKASGSFFHTLSPEERQTWQDTVDNAYDRFLAVISENRAALSTAELRDKVVIERLVTKRDEKGNPVLNWFGDEVRVKYTRRRADGGTFTAAQAKDLQLIDHVEDLPAAVRRAAATAGLPRFKAVIYDRTPGLLERLTGVQMRNPSGLPELPDLSSALTPRLWYLSPVADSGLLAPLP